METLLLTPRHWEIRRRVEGPESNALIRSEAVARSADLSELLEPLKLLSDRFIHEILPVVVPDTNVFLHFTFFVEAPWGELVGGRDVRLVVPLIVVGELDRLKSSANRRVASRAQKVLRELARLTEGHSGRTNLPRRGTVELFVDDPGHVRMRSNDDEIVEVVRMLSTLLPSPPCLVTGDLGMRLRASSLAVEVAVIPDEWRLPNVPDASDSQECSAS